jgi:hypothetical protein
MYEYEMINVEKLHAHLHISLMLSICNVIFINCKWVFTQWQWFTIRHNKQITHITQNNTTLKQNTSQKTTHTVNDTLHRMNTNTIT